MGRAARDRRQVAARIAIAKRTRPHGNIPCLFHGANMVLVARKVKRQCVAASF
jgi:hypothetical protein